MTRVSILFVLLIMVSSCESKEPDAQQIIDRAIKKSGGEAYENFHLEFEFRGRNYISKRNSGEFEYTRITRDSTGETIDSYSNSSLLKRTRNAVEEEVPDSLAIRIMNSINSVNYFVLLPYGLNDPAVNKSYLGEVKIKNEPYHKIRITFDEEGGGTDFEDVFIYWIHTEKQTMDYLAYRYYTDGGGLRFREALNPRVIGGLRFSDYNNYKAVEAGSELEELDKLFEDEKLKLLSVIETENIRSN